MLCRWTSCDCDRQSSDLVVTADFEGLWLLLIFVLTHIESGCVVSGGFGCSTVFCCSTAALRQFALAVQLWQVM